VARRRWCLTCPQDRGAPPWICGSPSSDTTCTAALGARLRADSRSADRPLVTTQPCGGKGWDDFFTSESAPLLGTKLGVLKKTATLCGEDTRRSRCPAGRLEVPVDATRRIRRRSRLSQPWPAPRRPFGLPLHLSDARPMPPHPPTRGGNPDPSTFDHPFSRRSTFFSGFAAGVNTTARGNTNRNHRTRCPLRMFRRSPGARTTVDLLGGGPKSWRGRTVNVPFEGSYRDST